MSEAKNTPLSGGPPEAPSSGDRHGAPEIMLRPDAMGTDDGLSKHPYVRESRRVVALKTIVESEV